MRPAGQLSQQGESAADWVNRDASGTTSCFTFSAFVETLWDLDNHPLIPICSLKIFKPSVGLVYT